MTWKKWVILVPTLGLMLISMLLTVLDEATCRLGDWLIDWSD